MCHAQWWNATRYPKEHPTECKPLRRQEYNSKQGAQQPAMPRSRRWVQRRRMRHSSIGDRAYTIQSRNGKWITAYEFLDRTVHSAMFTGKDAPRTDRSQPVYQPSRTTQEAVAEIGR